MANLIEQGISPHFIAQEMREASRGSFPLSPGVMTGHYAVSNLYWHYRRDILLKESVVGIFGNEKPDPPILHVPTGHTHINPKELNIRIWNDFLERSFTSHPTVNPTTEIRILITENARVDNINFLLRMEGKKSQIAPSSPTPSLLRAFLYEDGFPERNEFFTWLFSEMRADVANAQAQGFAESWSSNLKSLVATWDKHFPDIPFIPA